jgi:hypothetical protein
MGRRNSGACVLSASSVRAYGAATPDPSILGERHFGLPHSHPDAAIARMGLAFNSSHCLRARILLS